MGLLFVVRTAVRGYSRWQ